MANRYVILGTQLGMLIGLVDRKARQTMVDQIIETQHLEYSEEPLMKDINRYKKLLEESK